MRSWTLVPSLLNSIATQTRLWACASEATHPKKRSSSMTSVTGSPTGKDAPDTGQDSWTATMALLSIVALRVLGVCEAPACQTASRQTLLVKSRQSNFHFRGVHFIRGMTLTSLAFKHHLSDCVPTSL